MDKVSVLMLKDFALGGTDYEAGALIEVGKDVADLLIAKGIAEAKTLDEYIEETEKAAVAKTEEEAKAAAELETEVIEKAAVTKVHDRLADDPTGGFRSQGAFAMAVRAAGPEGVHPDEPLLKWRQASAEIKQTHVMVEHDDEQGGFLVPTQFIADLKRIALESSIVLPLAQFIPMGTNAVSMPAVNTTSNVNTFFGGITIYRPGEGASKSPSKPAFAKVTLTLHKKIVLVHVSDELLDDSPISIEPLLTEMAGQSIAFQSDDDYLNGTGVNMPLGCINAANPSLIVETRNIAGLIRFDDILDMWMRMWIPGRSRCIWLLSAEAENQLARMRDPLGAGGTPMFIGPGMLPSSLASTILGRPYFVTEKCSTLGVQGDIALVDLSQYMIGGKNSALSPKADTSIHLYFNYDITCFRYVLRDDGQPWWLSDVTPHNGGATYSPFVVLGTVVETTTTTTTGGA